MRNLMFGLCFIFLGTVVFASEFISDTPSSPETPIVKPSISPKGSMDFARAFMVHGQTNSFGAYLYYETVADNVSTSHEGYFFLNSAGLVVHFEVDGNVLWSYEDTPISGIPFPKSGQFINLQVYLYGYGEINSAGWNPITKQGRFWAEVLLPGDPIVIWMSPGQIEVAIYLPIGDLPAGVDLSTLAIRWSGDGYAAAYWSVEQGRFLVWIDPLNPPVSYDIYDSQTGIIYYSAVPFVYGNNPETVDGKAGLNLLHAGGVVELNFDSVPYQSMYHQKFQSYDWSDKTETYYSDSVFMSHLKGRKLTVMVYGLEGAITAELIRYDGTVDTVVMPLSGDGLYQPFVIQEGYEKVIIKLTGAPQENGGCYSISFWTQSSGGGGKG